MDGPYVRREFPGKDNYGKPKLVYVARLMAMSDDELYKETEQAIWLSAYAANNPRSDFHWHSTACHDECEARGKPQIYERAFATNMRQLTGR